MSGAKFAPGISFVPRHHPDELFYSFISHIQLYNAIPNAKTALKLLLESRCVIPSIDLPTHLDYFQQNLGAFSPFKDVHELIEHATLYPYFKAFLPPVRNELIKSKLGNTDGNGLKTAVGIVANRFGASSKLKSCPDCFANDIAIYGTPYWHRAHHLPGVDICVAHHKILNSFEIQSRLDNRHALLTPKSLISPVTNSASISHLAIKFTQLSFDLLNAKIQNHKPETRKQAYLEGLRNKHLTKGFQQVRWEQLTNEMCDYYDNFNWFAYQKRLFATEKNPMRWVQDLIQRPERALHPICHLLLIGYLFETLDSFSDCLNKQKTSSTPIRKLTSCKSNTVIKNSVLQNQSLSCREIAKRYDVSTNYVVKLRRILGVEISERKKTLSSSLTVAIQNDLLSSMTVKEIATKYGISAVSVYRILETSIEISNGRKELLKSIELNSRRAKWRQLITSYPEPSLKLLRSISPDTYSWLYKNDSYWLNIQNQALMPARNTTTASKVDWNQRDIYYANNAIKLASELKQQLPRYRVTTSRILRVLGIEATARCNQELLPLLVKILPIVTETIEQFQKVRIELTISDLINSNQNVPLWKVQRIAGLKAWTPELLDYAKTIITKKLDFDSALHPTPIP